MNKNTDYTLPTSYTQVPSWTADTTGYPGSTTSGNGVVANGAKPGATLATHLSVTNTIFGSFSVTVRLLLDGVVKATSSPQSVSSNATIAIDLSATADVTSGQVLTVEAQVNTGSAVKINGTGSYVRIT
ncbi:hypothetical protein ACWDNI_35970 [Nocardia niigatensis]